MVFRAEKMDRTFSRERTGMPNTPDISAMKAVVADWYGMPEMPMRILTREEEADLFEAEHPEVPGWCWEYIKHPIRQTFMWARHEFVDILVWCEESQSFRMVQDLCFKDAYPDVAAWHAAVRDIVADPKQKVWICFHE